MEQFYKKSVSSDKYDLANSFGALKTDPINHICYDGVFQIGHPPFFMDTLCLNRTWKFKLDPENIGISEGWQSNPKTLEQDSADIQAACCWEDLKQDYEGVA
jgi:hypothetical protein